MLLMSFGLCSSLTLPVSSAVMLGSRGGCSSCLGGWVRWIRLASAEESARDVIKRDEAASSELLTSPLQWCLGSSLAEDEHFGGTKDASRKLYDAVCAGNVAAVFAALQDGADLSQHFGEAQDSALHAAARVNNVVVMELLINGGASLEDRNANSETPILSAVREGSVHSLKKLVEARANVNAVDSNGQSGIAIAQAMNRPHFVSLLQTP